MADKDKIFANAKAWFAQQDIPDKCPKEGCTAVRQWRLGEVTKVNRTEYDRTIGHARAVRDPDLYAVALTCGWCGHHERTYEEEVPL